MNQIKINRTLQKSLSYSQKKETRCVSEFKGTITMGQMNKINKIDKMKNYYKNNSFIDDYVEY